MKEYNIIAIIVAAGSGERLGNTTPKQYLPLARQAILTRSVYKFLNHPQIDAVIVAYNPAHQSLYDNATAGLTLLPPVLGGSTRAESVRLALEEVSKYNPKKILIHDAARPMIDVQTISDVINALEFDTAVIPVIPVQDTIKKCENGKIMGTIPRENLFCAQTPQGFDYNIIYEAHKKIRHCEEQSDAAIQNSYTKKNNLDCHAMKGMTRNDVFTDDASLFEYLGKPVTTVQGSTNNFKITTIEDLKKAELFMETSFETRIGMGFDAHKFCPPKEDNNHIMLCGVAVPHPFSLEGHSDADVGLHALVDAILGAIAAGDIGTYFPPSDPKWKGADSSIFLKHAGEILKQKNASVINLDITIICESPKILPHRDKMCETIAQILGIENSRVSVKATTTENMGFTGRREGIAAQALANIKLEK